MDLNRFGLDTMVAGIESFEPSLELDMGIESQNEDQIVEEVHALVEANESLDRLLHTGLTDGLESVSETLKIIQLSDTIHTMNAIADGTESYDSDMSGLESALQYAGIDVASITGYTAGTEARDGGLAQPFRSAGASIKDSKAYKAVSDSWVGKAAAGVVKRIRSIWQWIVEKIMGKPIQNAHKIVEEALKKAGLPTDAITKPYQDRINKLTELSDKLSATVHQLSDVRDKQAEEIDSLKQTKAAADLSIKDKIETIRELQSMLESDTQKIKKLESNIESFKERESELMSGGFELGKELAEVKANLQALEKGAKPMFDLLVKNVDRMPAQAKKEILKLVQENKILDESYLKISKKIANVAKATPIPGKPKSGKRKGIESECALEDLIGFTVGAESMIETFEDTIVGVESLEIANIEIGLAACATLDAIDAGIECMNIDIFGHPYTGVDMNTQQVIAFTDRHDFGEAGTEAEETKKEEKPSETAKSEDAKKPGFFENMGAKAKKAGKWAKAKGRQFWKWIKSKISILEPIMDRLAMMTSKSFDLSALNESELGTSLATIDANLEKIAKLLDKEHKESAKSAEDYTKIISESKKKVSSANTVAPIRLIGASDLLKKVKKISKLVNKANNDKVENAAEMTSIMSETTKAIANFNLGIRRALRTAQKVAATTKDIPEQSESK